MKPLITVALLLFTLPVLGHQGPKPSTQPASANSKWTSSESKSLMDDSKTVTLTLRAENTISGFLKTSTPSLIIRCKENHTDVYVASGLSANPELGSYETFTVKVRLGTTAAKTEQWTESTSKDALFSPRAIPFARSIADTDSMLFEFTPFQSAPAVVRFDVRGLKGKLDAVGKACNWAELDRQQAVVEAQMAEKLRREAAAKELKARSGNIGLGQPLSLHGFKIPLPLGGWETPTTGPVKEVNPDRLDVFSLSPRENLKLFYQVSLTLPDYGWEKSASDSDEANCWQKLNPQTSKVEHLCLSFGLANHVIMAIEPED